MAPSSGRPTDTGDFWKHHARYVIPVGTVRMPEKAYEELEMDRRIGVWQEEMM